MEHAQTGRDAARATMRDAATDRPATGEGTPMRGRGRERERQVNHALRALDEMHRLGDLGRDDYRWRRRRLLESLGGAAGGIEGMAGDARGEPDDRTERDTVRRAVPAGELTAALATVRRPGTGAAEAKASRGRRGGARRVLMVALLLGLVAGVAAICWFMATT